MRLNALISLVAVTLLIGAGSASAQSRGNESAEQNVKQSQQYDALVCSNPGFRARRIAQECGSLKGSEFYQSCVDSFGCDKPVRATHTRRAPPSQTVH